MSSTFEVQPALVSVTFSLNADKEANIAWADLDAKIKDRIPPRLSTTLRGNIDWVSIRANTNLGTNCRVSFFGNDHFVTASTTNTELLGVQAFTAANFVTASDNANKNTHMLSDALKMLSHAHTCSQNALKMLSGRS